MSIAKSRALEYRNFRTKSYETDDNETDIVAQYIEENAFIAGYNQAVDDIERYVEKEYRELSSPQGELTQEGRGYLIGMGDVLRFIFRQIKNGDGFEI